MLTSSLATCCIMIWSNPVLKKDEAFLDSISVKRTSKRRVHFRIILDFLVEWWNWNPANSGRGSGRSCCSGVFSIAGLRDVERSQGTQASSAESLHRPTAYFSQKAFITCSLLTFLLYCHAVVYQNSNDDLRGPYVEMPKNSLWNGLRISSCALVSPKNSMA